MFIASFIAAYKYGNAKPSFGYAPFNAHEGGFILPFPASLMEATSSVGFTILLPLSGSDLAMSLLVLKRSDEIDCGHYVGDELPFLGYNFETGDVSDVFATQASNRSKVNGEIVIEATRREVAWLKITSCASVENCELEWKRLNAELDKEEVLDVDVPDTDSLELLLQRYAGRMQDIGVVHPGVASECWYSKAELMRAQYAVPTTFEMVSDLSREVLASRDEVSRSLTAAEGKVARGVKKL